MRYVLVNGQLVWDDGKQTQRRPGRVLRGPGYRRPTVQRNHETADIPSLDAFFLSFMEQHRVPGCAAAVSRGDRLLYSRGFGWADVAQREPVQAESRFRIASISKSITAVAVLKLVEQGKLKLDDRAYDWIQDEPLILEGKEVEPRLKTITIRQLLQHRGGWDRDKSFDAMFQSVRFADMLGKSAPAGPNDVIRCMFTQPLDFDPGARYAYSNFGYCLLGRIIEKAAGKTYDQYVQEEVLRPAGATTMQLGRTLDSLRAEKEVRYYDPASGGSVFAPDIGKQVPQPYGAWNLEAMDAHGGWIASAVDLVRFASALDRRSSKLVLRPDSLDALVAYAGSRRQRPAQTDLLRVGLARCAAG
jgi:N-acyl-D-amino-acid deacylase